VEDLFKHAGGNWQLEFTTLKNERSAVSTANTDKDYLESLALARGASVHGVPVPAV